MTDEQWNNLSIEDKSVYSFISENVYDCVVRKEITKEELTQLLFRQLEYREKYKLPEHLK